MEMIKGLLVTPNEVKVVEFEDTLKNLQHYVDGIISTYYPFRDEVTIVLNDEGKLLDLPISKMVIDSNGNVIDFLAGNFLLLASPCDKDYFVSLSDEQIEKYTRILKNDVIIYEA